MTAQHTPGPWEVADCLMNEDERWVHSSELGGVIAGVWPWGDDEVGEQQREANARLIAAAPDLLAALDNLVSFMTDDHTCQDCGYEEEREDGGIETLPNGQHSRTCSIPAALAAIRKARGE